MIKVLGLALYGPLAASNRYRLGQYVSGLAGLGIDLQVFHLLGDDYLRARFGDTTLPISIMLKDAWGRAENLWRQNDYDAVILQCELMPLMPGWLERFLIRKPYIYDFDDAFYLKYRTDRKRLFSPLLRSKFDEVMAGAAIVTAGNHVLAKYARQYNSTICYLPTVVDTLRYIPKTLNRSTNIFTVGWIGSPSTAIYLNELIVPLSLLGQECSIQFIVIGGRSPKIPNVTVVELDWDEQTELELINSFDVGVMPLPDDEWARGKCAFKLIQYMACELPVIASPVGANVDVVDATCGLLASTPQEWLEAFRTLRDKPNLRAKMGEAGRERVIECYSLHQNLPVLADAILQITNN